MKTAKETLLDELSDSHIAILQTYPFFLPWIIDGMKEYATQVAKQALKDASENAHAYVKNHGIKIDKQSILNTIIIIP